MVFDLFKKNSFHKLENFYLQETTHDKLNQYPWMALAINQRTISESLLTKELVLTPLETKTTPGISLQLADIASGMVHHVYQGPKKIYSGEMKDEMEIKNARTLFNNLIDTILEKEIKTIQTSMNASEFSPRQLESEEKALEWMRVSFEILTKGVLESLTNPDFLFQTTLFLGVNPKTKMREMRLMTFNLDMTFLLLQDNNLRILIYNKKPGDKDSELKPALTGDYSFRKREMFDQFVQLLSVISKGIHA